MFQPSIHSTNIVEIKILIEEDSTTMNRRLWIKRTVALLFVGAGMMLIASAQVDPTTFLKLKHDPGKSNMADQASFASMRGMQAEVVTAIGGSPALSLKHPPDGISCYTCHPGVPRGVYHSSVALNEANPAASCGVCHVNNLYERLNSLPYFTEIKFALTGPASVADAETRLDNAVAMDSTLNYSGVIKNDSEAKWEFEVQRLPTERGTLPESFNTLLDKTANALEVATNNHITTPSVSPEVQVKIEAKASTVGQLGGFVSEFGALDTTMLAAVPAATVTRSAEAKWTDPALPYDTAYAFIKNTISAQFGQPKTENPSQITWDLGGGASVVANFSRPEDNFTHETKVTFSKIALNIEDQALALLDTIVAQYPTVALGEAKLAHQYVVKNGTPEQNALVIDTFKAYTTLNPLPDKEFKYEVLIKKGTDVFTNLLDFFYQKRADYSGRLVKTKSELKWRPLDATTYQYKVEVVAAQRD
jgi:hypothetical protein